MICAIPTKEDIELMLPEEIQLKMVEIFYEGKSEGMTDVIENLKDIQECNLYADEDFDDDEEDIEE